MWYRVFSENVGFSAKFQLFRSHHWIQYNWNKEKNVFLKKGVWNPAHPCLCMYLWQCCAFTALLIPRPWNWGQSDQTDYLQTHSVWPAASHTFQYFQTDFQKRELKGIGVVKTWHSQKRAAGPRDYQETSHMTQCCRNDSTARVTDEGLLIDIVLLPFSPLSISVFLPLFHHGLSLRSLWVWFILLGFQGQLLKGTPAVYAASYKKTVYRVCLA